MREDQSADFENCRLEMKFKKTSETPMTNRCKCEQLQPETVCEYVSHVETVY